MKLNNKDGKLTLSFRDKDPTINYAIEGMPAFGVADTVYICGNVYAKTEEAFEAVQKAAQNLKYDDSITKEEDRDKGVYYRLDVSAAECGSCGKVISSRGVRGHNHKCEHCGEPTYIEFTRDGAINFQFLRKGERVGRSTLSFRIFGYREHEDKPNELLLFPEPILGEYAPPRHEKRGWNGLRGGLFDVRDPEEARMILEEAQDLYTREIVKDPLTGVDIEVLVLKDAHPHMITEESVFNTHETVGQMHNHRMIKYYDGKKYGEWDSLPVLENFHLKRNYIGGRKHSLTEPNIHEVIIHASGQVARADYYYQDGREAFCDVVYKRMTAFVENFVDVDPQEWAKFLIKVPKDGPGFIRGLANWCAGMSDGISRDVQDEPNFGNALVGMAKLLSGDRLSYAESVAMHEGAESDQGQLLAEAMLKKFNDQKEGEGKAFRRRLSRWMTNPDAAPEQGKKGPDGSKNEPS